MAEKDGNQSGIGNHGHQKNLEGVNDNERPTPEQQMYPEEDNSSLDWEEEDNIGEEDNSPRSRHSCHSNQPVISASHNGMKESLQLHKS